jgi:hypothetical protein
MKRAISIIVLLSLVLAGCNQPFEPNGPVNNTLVLYGILSSRTDTQYVRLSSTFGALPAPDIRNASVTVAGGGQVIAFRDTTVFWRDAEGAFSPTNVYVAYNAPVSGNVEYRLQASTPSGLTASASLTALSQPFFSLKPGATRGFFVLTRQFKTLSGAAILHFYLDYFVLVNNGWELHTEEVPSRSYVDAGGNDAFEYPSFSPVATLAAAGNDVSIDSTLLTITKARVFDKFRPAPLVYLDVRFIVTQIDDFLYDYYYLNNGAVDNSTIRLDVPDFTNIRGGYGVFGSRAEVILLLPLAR